MNQTSNIASLFMLLMLIGCCSVKESQAQEMLNKQVELLISNVTTNDDAKGKLRVFDASSKRSLIIVSDGYTISWKSGEGQKLRFQFPEVVDDYIDWNKESEKYRQEGRVALFHLPEEATLMGKIKLPKGHKEKFFVLEYALFDTGADNFIRGDSPPKIIFMFK